jgi:MATE family multidrug resistance protein
MHAPSSPSTSGSLSFSERPLRDLLRLAGPMAASTLSYSLMTLVDTLLIGRVGRSQLAGVALGGLTCFMLVCFSQGVLRASSTLHAQAVGAGKRDQLPHILGAALASALALGVVTAGMGQIVARGLVHLSATSEAGGAAARYVAIRILGAPLTLAYVALRESRYGQGDTRAPMRATVVANLVNIGLASAFIFALGWGVEGAAVATVIANAVELGGLVLGARAPLAALRWPRRGGDLAHLRHLWRLGIPIGLQFVLEVGAFAILSVLVSLLAEEQMAAHQITIQVIHFSFLPAWAVGEAAGVLAGQAVGADRDDLVRRLARLATGVAAGYAGLCGLAFALAAPWLARAFTSDVAVITITVRLLYVAAFFQIFDAANVVARGVLRGAGDVRFAARVGIATAWLATPPLTWLLGYRLGWGAVGGWLGMSLEIMAGAAILLARIGRGGWLPAAARARKRLHGTAGA